MEIELVFKVILALWSIGIVLSVLCLFIQIFLYAMLPSCRKVDQRILTQLTIARFLNVVFEYGSIYESDSEVVTCVVLLMYFHSDAAVVIWMSVFTKRLYDKLVVVFSEEPNFICVAASVWVCTLPAGIIALTLTVVNPPYIFKYCSAYCIVKCIVLALNFMVFCRIFQVIIAARTNRDLKSTLKTCVNSFLLISVTSLQVFIRFFYTNNTPFFVPSHDDYRNCFLILFGLISCYQVVAITLIFIMILSAANTSDQTIIQRIIVKVKSRT